MIKLRLHFIIVYLTTSITTLAFSPGSTKNEILRRKSPFVADSGALASMVEPATETNDESKEKSALSLSETFPIFSDSLDSLGFVTPTPIQAASAQRALEDENLLLIAPTGSGKTLAYFLPALSKCFKKDKTVLVVAPTRELALQLKKDAISLLSVFSDDAESGVFLAVKGVEAPTPRELNMATMLVGTPSELHTVLTTIDKGLEFVKGGVLSAVIMDEVDILLPSPRKNLRTGLDIGGNKKKKTQKNSPQEQRRKQEQKRKLMAAKRSGVEINTAEDIISPTEKILNIIASNRLAGGADTTPPQVLAGSATASRKTLDRLNRSLRNAAAESSAPYNLIWSGDTKACRPIEESNETGLDSAQDLLEKKEDKTQHTIRAVTVPSQVKHKYLEMSKESASQAPEVLKSVAAAAKALNPKLALVFLCGEFAKTNVKAKAEPKFKAKGATSKARRNSELKHKKLASKFLAQQKKREATGPASPISARKACEVLNEQGIDAQPLHVALGLEKTKEKDMKDNPKFLVTFEGSARGLHFDDVDAVFVVGRPSSAASYLHLAGRVGRSSTDNGSIVVRPGTVVSFCTKGSTTELQKWTKQVGGESLEELSV